MSSFNGFPPGKVRFTRIPAVFFTELLPQIDDLGELKTTLYTLWRLDRMEGDFRYLRQRDFSEDETLMRGLDKNVKKAKKVLTEALQRSVERGTLIFSQVELDTGTEKFYFLNTLRGQAAVKAIELGEWQPTNDPKLPIKLNLERPNVFRLYEEHIGPLTPMIADALKEAEEEYPPEWIEEAIKLAVFENVRKLSYIEAILRDWKVKSKDARENRQDSKKDYRRFSKGKYGKIIKKRRSDKST
jgi:DnaD/phage-associated family protein